MPNYWLLVEDLMTTLDRKSLPNGTQDIEHFCNKCGMSCRGHVGNFNGLINAKVVGAYDSSHLEDGAIYEFSLCEKCLLELINTFSLDAYQGNQLVPDDLLEAISESPPLPKSIKPAVSNLETKIKEFIKTNKIYFK